MSRKHHAHRHTPAAARRRARRSNPALLWGGLLTLALIAAAVLVFRPRAATEAPSPGPPSEISVAQAYEGFEQGAFMLDVREPDEWDAFHIPGATLIPLGQLAARVDELPRDQRIIVVCRSGNRSSQGRDTLLAAGFSDVTSMTGGVTAWSSAGYPIEGTRP
jgi:rhodanese-related sulfurtransferase